jgi:hypothetical protein
MIDNIHAYTFPAAFALLPGAMDTPPARAMLLANAYFARAWAIVEGDQ